MSKRDPKAGRSQRFTLSERLAYFIFTFCLSLGSLLVSALMGELEFGWRLVIVGSLAGLVFGCIVAFAGDTVRDLVFYFFFP